MTIRKTSSKLLAALLLAALVLLALPPVARAATELNLTTFDTNAYNPDTPSSDGFMYESSLKVIVYTGDGPLTIMGEGPYQIHVDKATEVILAYGASFGANGYALQLYAQNATVEGGGANVVLNGLIGSEGNLTIEGTIGDINNGGGHAGIMADGDVAINGNIGDITAGVVGILSNGGSVTVSGSVGDIKASSIGIGTQNGNITVERGGSVGNISAEIGIGAGLADISQIVGSVASGGIVVAGSIGNINANNIGIFSRRGNITVESGGSVGDIHISNPDGYGFFAATGDYIIHGTLGNFTGGTAMFYFPRSGGTVAVQAPKPDAPAPIVAILTDVQKSGDTFTFKTYIANAKGNMAGATVTVQLNEKYKTTVTIGEDGVGFGTIEAPGYAWDTAHISTRPNVPGGAGVGTAYRIYSTGEVVRA